MVFKKAGVTLREFFGASTGVRGELPVLVARVRATVQCKAIDGMEYTLRGWEMEEIARGTVKGGEQPDRRCRQGDGEIGEHATEAARRGHEAHPQAAHEQHVHHQEDQADRTVCGVAAVGATCHGYCFRRTSRLRPAG